MHDLKKDLLINSGKRAKVKKRLSRPVLFLLTFGLSSLGYGAGEPTSTQVDTTLKASSADNDQVVCTGDSYDIAICRQHKKEAKTHANQAEKLAGIADEQQSHADRLHKEAKGLINDNPQAANDLGTVASQAQTAAKVTAAAAHAHATASIAHTEAANAVSEDASIADCNLMDNQDKDSCQYLNNTQDLHKKVGEMIDRTGVPMGTDGDIALTPESRTANDHSDVAD